ncbi:MAG: hypothetical protein EXS36_18440 [Pedosphaera sp.]|nr:hypothetical protein [Pedosphaera sp.]
MRQIDSNGDGVPDGWEITERNGTRHTLGRFRGQNNRWSVVEHPEKASSQPFNRVYCWRLDSTVDRHGNRIEYEYIQGAGVLYPYRIQYGHLEGSVHEVLFQYEDRPDAFDDYRPTFSARLDRRLKRVETFGNRARLDRADEKRLGFSQENLEATLLPNPPAFVTYSHAATRQMDVNFDKRGDFVNLEPSFRAMKVNTFFIERSGRWVAGESMLPPSYPLANTFQGPDGQPNPCVQLADMNGDRVLDQICLAASPSAAGQRLRISYWPLCGLGRYAAERSMATDAADTLEIGNADLRDVFLDDITGDGLADLLALDGSGPETVLTLRVNIAGQRWSPPYTRAGLARYAPRDPAAPTIVRLADLNANGSLDLLFRNTAPEDSWDYVELLPAGKHSLMTGIDNGLGKRISIDYGSAAEDEQRAREAGNPWRTFAPIPLQVVRQIRTAGGQDLNGDGHEDTAVLEFSYRDPYYEGFEREFRGFAFAQRVEYGDDFLFDPASGLIKASS